MYFHPILVSYDLPYGGEMEKYPTVVHQSFLPRSFQAHPRPFIASFQNLIQSIQSTINQRRENENGSLVLGSYRNGDFRGDCLWGLPIL